MSRGAGNGRRRRERRERRAVQAREAWEVARERAEAYAVLLRERGLENVWVYEHHTPAGVWVWRVMVGGVMHGSAFADGCVLPGMLVTR